MLISVIELSYAIQDDPRVYHSRSAIVNNENVIVFKRLLCFKVQQMQQLVDLVEAGCNTCTRIQIPPRDPTVWKTRQIAISEEYEKQFYTIDFM